MSGFISVIILILVLLIQSLMRLSPSIFAYFLNSAIAKKSSRLDRFSAYYVLGAEIATALLLILTFSILPFIFSAEIATTKIAFQENPEFFNPAITHSTTGQVFIWTIFGLFVAEAIINFFFYFKKKSTQLFISRRTAKNLVSRAEKVRTRTDIFVLGFISRILELPFTLPLYVLTAFGAIVIPSIPCCLVAIIYLITSIIPFFVTYAFFQTSHNLADYQRLHVKTRNFTRRFISASFLLIAVLILTLILKGSL